MSDYVDIWGIKTNNLKGISVRLKKHSLNLVVGPSGSGKSSFAYDTVAQIGQHEFAAMFSDNVAEPTYRVDGYSGMVAAVPIHQSNYNTNMRSTIGTYFGLNRSIALIYAAQTGKSEDFFTLNKEGNLCESCHGLGTLRKLDANRIIDYNVPLRDNPVRCWNRYKDFYRQIIVKFCAEKDIDSSKTFRDLTQSERDLLLYGESDEKYSIRYKKTGSFSRRTTKYHGMLTGTPMIVGFSPGKQYYGDIICPDCLGKKYAGFFEEYRVNGISIGEFMTTPFCELHPIARSFSTNPAVSKIPFILNGLIGFLSKAIELNLGHLSFNRSIPTLSGGELQRLRMVQVFNTQLADLLVVLDEPLAGLSGDERLLVFDNIVDLSSRHTLLVVDHSDAFVRSAGNVIALGKGGGKNGGSLVDAGQFFAAQKEEPLFSIEPGNGSLLHFSSSNRIYGFSGIDVTIEQGCMNLLTGKSGVGKSTLLREYLPQLIEEYSYVSQKPLSGNKTSSVVTLLGIFIRITELFAKKYSKDKSFFSNQLGCEGACPSCSGAGYVEYGDGESRSRIECADCAGTGFNSKLGKYSLDEKTVIDIWNMTVDEARCYFDNLDSGITKLLDMASSLMLGHLTLGQSSSSLSGGENIRIKLMKSARAKKNASVIGVDEPFRGLSNREIYQVAKYLDTLMKTGKTILVVDHTESIERYFSRHVVLENHNGILIGTDS
ncbi:ATP-binding cassette domain-containing protein [Coriobacteriales bacterium OH1046]|nr:ATP-binding cassette domain-containing protein [Coriobacteriales bacterium OH1046]